MLDEIRARLKFAPFVPFRIVTAGGREYPVPTPDHTWMPPGTARVHVFGEEATLAVIPALLISGLLTTDSEQTVTASS